MKKMPEFLSNMVARESFWWALLACAIVGFPCGVLGGILQKINKTLGMIVQFVPSVLFTFYIWHIRGHVVWLVFAVFGVLNIVFVMRMALKK
ncbi:MAG: hypothetical protein LBS35_00905 [Synergistaceae bacterium]|nr:hypothetical protein [Synergistaceae bacterium]